jgi:hypothetical protein
MKKLIENVNTTKNTCMANCEVDMISHAGEFQLDYYESEDLQNKDGEDHVPMLKANVRPFKNWFDTYIGPERRSYSGCGVKGIFAVSRDHIRNFPLESYRQILTQLETHISPEVGHYVERSWGAFFHPIEKDFLIKAP